MIIMTGEVHLSKKDFAKELKRDHVIVLDGKRKGVYPKFKVLSIHKRTAENVIRYSLGMPLVNDNDGIVLSNQ